ncbi:MAG TPA: hypothetical protein VHY77_00055, partial [Acidimicrobiales bacterium]|nr:hypothetical protein [Acidimicrobiales bacterium]
MSDAVLEWFDSHCHLQDEFLEATDEGTGGRATDAPPVPTGTVRATALNGALARASEAGVTRLVCVGTGGRSSEEAVGLARALRAPGSV